jgi:hypothetical protein
MSGRNQIRAKKEKEVKAGTKVALPTQAIIVTKTLRRSKLETTESAPRV